MDAVTLGKLVNQLFGPWFPHWYNRDNKDIPGVLKEAMYDVGLVELLTIVSLHKCYLLLLISIN